MDSILKIRKFENAHKTAIILKYNVKNFKSSYYTVTVRKTTVRQKWT